MSSRSSATRFLAAGVLLVASALSPVAAKTHGSPVPSPSVAPSVPPEDPAVTKVARREFVLWQAGTIDPKNYLDDAKAKATPDKVADVSQHLGPLGALDHSEWVGPVDLDDAPPGYHGYLYKMVCSRATVYEQLILGPQNKVAGILFRDKLGP